MNENGVSIKTFIHGILLATFWLLIFLNLPSLCHSHGHTHDHHHHRHEEPAFKYTREANDPHISSDKFSKKIEEVADKNSWSLWVEALGSTLLISAAPFLVLFTVPLDKSKEKEHLLKLLLSFASGGLLGDAFLHLIPHALAPHSGKESHHGHSHLEESEGHGHDMTVGLSVLMGILTFLLVEKMVRLLKGGHGHSHGQNVISESENNHKAHTENLENEKQDRGDTKKKKKEGKADNSKKGNV